MELGPKLSDTDTENVFLYGTIAIASLIFIELTNLAGKEGNREGPTFTFVSAPASHVGSACPGIPVWASSFEPRMRKASGASREGNVEYKTPQRSSPSCWSPGCSLSRILERGDLGPPVVPGGQEDQLGILEPPSVASCGPGAASSTRRAEARPTGRAASKE
jgi:hypothetical protein